MCITVFVFKLWATYWHKKEINHNIKKCTCSFVPGFQHVGVTHLLSNKVPEPSKRCTLGEKKNYNDIAIVAHFWRQSSQQQVKSVQTVWILTTVWKGPTFLDGDGRTRSSCLALQKKKKKLNADSDTTILPKKKDWFPRRDIQEPLLPLDSCYINAETVVAFKIQAIRKQHWRGKLRF